MSGGHQAPPAPKSISKNHLPPGLYPFSLAVPVDGTEQQLDEQLAVAEPAQDISRVPLKHAQGTKTP